MTLHALTLPPIVLDGGGEVEGHVGRDKVEADLVLYASISLALLFDGTILHSNGERLL